MIYFKRPPSLPPASALPQQCAPASSPRIWARCSCVRGAYAPPSRSTEGLGDFSDLLAEADPAGAAGAACSALGRLSGLDGCEHGFQCQFECRPPHFVRRVGTASLKPVSSSVTSFDQALCSVDPANIHLKPSHAAEHKAASWPCTSTEACARSTQEWE